MPERPRVDARAAAAVAVMLLIGGCGQGTKETSGAEEPTGAASSPAASEPDIARMKEVLNGAASAAAAAEADMRDD